MSRTKPEDVIAGKNRPFTGKEYLESLRDDREVYIYGERVPDVTAHPAFRNAARSIAKLYDALHDPKHKEVLTSPTGRKAITPWQRSVSLPATMSRLPTGWRVGASGRPRMWGHSKKKCACDLSLRRAANTPLTSRVVA